jgi:hypothetical protein
MDADAREAVPVRNLGRYRYQYSGYQNKTDSVGKAANASEQTK